MKAFGAPLVVLVKRFGYEVVDLREFRKFLTDAGAAGWEVVGFEEQGWVFKRPLK